MLFLKSDCQRTRDIRSGKTFGEILYRNSGGVKNCQDTLKYKLVIHEDASKRFRCHIAL